MAPVVEERQEAAVEPRERPDRQDDRQHEEGAGAECTDAQIDRRRPVLGRVEPVRQKEIRADIEHDRRDQYAVLDELRPVPLHRAKGGADAWGPGAVGAGVRGGARSTSAMVKPGATAKARTGQSTR